MPGRGREVVSNRGSLVWTHRMWSTEQVRRVHQSCKSSAVDLESDWNEYPTATPTGHTSYYSRTTAVRVGSVGFSRRVMNKRRGKRP